jgi:hypothetical protein
MTKFNRFLSTLVLSFTACITGVTSANALTSGLGWTGDSVLSPTQTYSLTGSFTGLASIDIYSL